MGRRRTRIHEGNYCTVGCFSLTLGRLHTSGFGHSYKEDEYIWGKLYNGKRFIEHRHLCGLVLNPAQFLRDHCQTEQTQEIVKSFIWPEVAIQLVLIAQQSDGDAYCLGFDQEEQKKILRTPLKELPLFVGQEFKHKVTQRILEIRLKHGGKL